MRPQALPSLGLALSDAKDMYAEQSRLHSAALCHGRRDARCDIDADVSTGTPSNVRTESPADVSPGTPPDVSTESPADIRAGSPPM